MKIPFNNTISTKYTLYLPDIKSLHNLYISQNKEIQTVCNFVWNYNVHPYLLQFSYHETGKKLNLIFWCFALDM